MFRRIRKERKKKSGEICYAEVIRLSVLLPLFAPRRFTKWKEGNTLHEYFEFPSFPVEYIHFVSTLRSRVQTISIDIWIYLCIVKISRTELVLFLESRDSDVNAASRIIGPPLNCRSSPCSLSVCFERPIRSPRLARRITERCSRANERNRPSLLSRRGKLNKIFHLSIDQIEIP